MTKINHSLNIDSSGLSDKQLADRITQSIAQEKRPGGLLYRPESTLSDRDYLKTINNDLLEEKLEEYKREILNDVNQLIINVLNSKQQPGRSQDALLIKRLTEICSDDSTNKEASVVAAIASHYQDVAGGAVYQLLNNVYRRLI